MVRLSVRDYSIYSPVSIDRRTSGAVQVSMKHLALITERPLQGSAFDAKKVMEWVVYGDKPNYYGV